jgi:hypothetical protein
VFSTPTLRALRQVTEVLFWSVLASSISQAPVSYFLTQVGSGHPEFSLNLGSDNVEVLFLASMALVIARVMTEAARMADENVSFV